ncbi:MAG: dNTP triphosphohydrolase [Acidimicrobiia bacterium]|nr:dNTP triphosphohydrolase [Acidimicrobiia bacterium]
MPFRSDRIRETSETDPREAFQRDRDRVLYSPEFRRLSGVTQVASAGEGDVFHNRLTHSLKVAQLGRRMAERLLRVCPSEIENLGCLDPDVVEAAALAHDLGHPPFGHDGEDVLCQMVEQNATDGKERTSDGFEGNAQSFRIATRLAAHIDNHRDGEAQLPGNSGLNLTRATLNAILKYPWLRSESGKHHRKWGAYRVDQDRFEWARAGSKGEGRGLEAELMDWADDVTYAVHDLEDFYRAGLIPIDKLLDRAEQKRLFTAAIKRKPHLADGSNGLERVLRAALGPMPLLDRPYDGGLQQHTIMNSAVSSQITSFVGEEAVQISDTAEQGLVINPEVRRQVEILQEVTRYYVIDHPRLVTVREGQRQILKTLFNIYLEAIANERNPALLPQATIDRLDRGDEPCRLVANLLARMTERQAIQTYRKLTGIIPSPVAHFDV